MWEKLLPPAGPLRGLAFVTLADSVGTGLSLTVAALYFTRVFSVAQVAVGLSAAGFAALVCAIPLGALGDRLGHRRTWVLLYLVLAAAFAAYPFVRSFPLLVLTMVVVALAEVGVSPVRGAYLSFLAGPAGRVRARAYNQAVMNVGFVVGAAGASVVLRLDAGYAGLLLANAASYVVGALVLTTLPAGVVTPPKDSAGVCHDRRFLLVAVLNGLLLCYLAVLTVALPLWIVHRTEAPRWSVGALVVVNTVLVVVFQVRASRGSETVPGAAAAVRRAGWALLVACLVFAASGAVGGAPAATAVAVAGVVALTAAELWHSSGSWGVSFGLAPEDRQGQYLGAFAMGSRVYDTVGPGLVTALTLGAGPSGWVVLGVLFLVLSRAVSACAVSACAVSACARRVGGDVRPHGDQHRDHGEPGDDERQHPEARVGEQPGHGGTSLDRDERVADRDRWDAGRRPSYSHRLRRKMR
jgi:MFS family permease